VRVVIHEEPGGVGRRFWRSVVRRVGPGTIVIAILVVAFPLSAWMYTVTEAPGDRLPLAGMIVLSALILIGGLFWWRSQERRRRALVRDALWVSRALAFTGPHDGSGVSFWAAWSEGASHADGGPPPVLLVLTARSFELVPVFGPPERLPVPLERVAVVDVVFGDRLNERGFTLRLTEGRVAHFMGQPDRALAEQLRTLGAEVVSVGASGVADLV